MVTDSLPGSGHQAGGLSRTRPAPRAQPPSLRWAGQLPPAGSLREAASPGGEKAVLALTLPSAAAFVYVCVHVC